MCIGEAGRANWCYDWAVEAVRTEKLAMLREVLFDYGADGIELDFMFEASYFKEAAIKSVGIPTFNTFLASVKALTAEAVRHSVLPTTSLHLRTMKECSSAPGQANADRFETTVRPLPPIRTAGQTF